MNEDDRRLGASARSRQIHVEHLPLVVAMRDVVPDRQAMLRAGAKDLAEPVDHQLRASGHSRPSADQRSPSAPRGRPVSLVSFSQYRSSTIETELQIT